MIRSLFLTIIMASLFKPVWAQVSETFSDHDFIHDPSWLGDDSLFRVNTVGELQLNGSTAKDAGLSTPFFFIDNDTMEWNFYTRFMLNPSTQNFSRFYIWSPAADLKAATDAYYVQLGGSTGNTDSISFYKQAGSVRTKLIAGRAGTVAKTNNKVRIKLIRDPGGVWTLFSDTSGGVSFVAEGTTTDTTFRENGYMGWFIRYSAGNAKNHYLDDIYAGPLRHDTTPCRIERIEIADEKNLVLFLTEQPDVSTVTEPSAYLLNESHGGV